MLSSIHGFCDRCTACYMQWILDVVVKKAEAMKYLKKYFPSAKDLFKIPH